MIGSVAVVARNSEGQYVGSLAVVFPSLDDPPALESLACREALALAKDLDLHRLLVSSDCKQVVIDLADGTGGSYANIIKEIRLMSTDFIKLSFIHEGSFKPMHHLAIIWSILVCTTASACWRCRLNLTSTTVSKSTAFTTQNVDWLRRHQFWHNSPVRVGSICSINQKGQGATCKRVLLRQYKRSLPWQSVYYCASITLHHLLVVMASTELLSSFRTPGSVPFKWELRPGIPKQPAGNGDNLPASSLQLPPRLAVPPAAATAAPSLQLPPRLAMPPAAATAAPSLQLPPRLAVPSSASGRALASASSVRRSCTAPSKATTTPRHRRSMSARFATSLALPFMGPRWWGRSKDEDDVAFAALYGDKIVS